MRDGGTSERRATSLLIVVVRIKNDLAVVIIPTS